MEIDEEVDRKGSITIDDELSSSISKYKLNDQSMRFKDRLFIDYPEI